MIIVFGYWAAFVFYQTTALEQHLKYEKEILYGDTVYLVIGIDANWFEAEFMCESSKNSKLAIVNDVGIRSALNDVLIGTLEFVKSGFWIGAKSTRKGGGFTWINDVGIYEQYDRNGGSIGFKDDVVSCLIFTQKTHNSSRFVEGNCIEKRMFICEKLPENKLQGVGQVMCVTTHVINEYYTEGLQRTWKDAVHQCRRSHNAYLADFRDNDEIIMLGPYLLMGRPSIKNLWVGGFYINGNWRYLDTGEVIPNEMDNNTGYPPWNPRKLQVHHMYPEWPINRERVHAGCLTLDKHFSFHPRFLEARCEQLLSYVCAKEYTGGAK